VTPAEGFEVELYTLAQHGENVVGAHKKLRLPFAPFIGLELRFGETCRFLVEDIEYWPEDGVFVLDEGTHVVERPDESLADYERTWRDAGFEIFEPQRTPPKRHLKVVKPEPPR
jgi:hypothetical protein